MRLVKQLRHYRQVIFDQGNFDHWCVYVVEPDGYREAPFDTEYFTDFQNMNRQYSGNKIYQDFLKVYHHTNTQIEQATLQLIDHISSEYLQEHQELIEQWFAVIYAGMIAEENKQYAVLKKRIKHLGMYQILNLNTSPQYAAHFSRGKKWQDLHQIMLGYGI